MKRVFLLVFVSGLLATWGFAQTPDAGSNTNQANLNGCLGGSEGNYTVAENGTGQIFKISTSSVDLKPHLGHAVKLMGHKAGGAVSSGASDNSFAVTELNMMSEHCAAAAASVAAAPVATVISSSETIIAPAANAAAPSTPASDAAAPAVSVIPSSETIIAPAANAAAPSTPASDAAAPAVSVIPPSATVIAPAANAAPPSATVATPAADATHPTPPSVHPRRLSGTQAAAATPPAATVRPSSEAVSPPAADTAAPAATSSPSSETATPAAATTTPTVTHRAGSLWLLIPFGVLVIVLGTLGPLLGRWRRRKTLKRTGTPNLSFTNEASLDRDEPEPYKVA